MVDIEISGTISIDFPQSELSLDDFVELEMELYAELIYFLQAFEETPGSLIDYEDMLDEFEMALIDAMIKNGLIRAVGEDKYNEYTEVMNND